MIKIINILISIRIVILILFIQQGLQYYHQTQQNGRWNSLGSSNKENDRQPSRQDLDNLDTQYDVVHDVCEDFFGWRIAFQKDAKQWDLYWTDTSISTEMLMKMKSHQKINHFPGMTTLSRKNTLAKNIKKMQEHFETEYDFFPTTWLLPQDINSFKKYLVDARGNQKQKFFIVKPEASSQGKGIYLTHSDNQFRFTDSCVIQQYIHKPLLFDGLKFDLRIYVLVAGCDPLRLYIYNEGLVRFSTEQYESPTDKNMSNLFMHLTNYAINKKHPGFIQNQSQEHINIGHKRSLSQFFKTLRQKGVNSAYIWSQIKDISVKTILSGQPFLAHQYRVSQPNNVLNNMCFQILGFDFLIQRDEKVFLLEINHSPSFKCDSPLDQLLKSNLIADTINLMGINTQSRNDLLYESFLERDIRIKTGKRFSINKIERERLIAQTQIYRDEFEDQNCGSYERIYPSADSELQLKYEMLMEDSSSRYANNQILSMGIRKRFMYQHTSTRNYMSLPKKKTLVTQEQEQVEQKIDLQKYRNGYDVSLPRLNNTSNAESPLLTASKRFRAAKLQPKYNEVNLNIQNLNKLNLGDYKKQLQNGEQETTMFSRYYKR